MVKHKAIKHIIEVTLSNVSSIISGVLIGFLIPKILPVDDYGMYKTFTLYMTYAGFFSLGIIDGIVLDYGGHNYDQLERGKFRAYWKWYLVIHVISALALALISFFIANSDYSFLLILLALNIIANNITGYFQQISQITQRFEEYSIRKVIQSLLNIIAVLIICLGNKVGIIPNYKIYVLFLVGINILLSFWYLITYRDIVFGESYTFNETKSNVKHLMYIGFPLLFANLCSTLILTLDRQFVNVLFDTSTYAVYAFAYNMLSIVTVATSAVSTVIYPILKRSDEMKLKERYPVFIEIVLLFVFGALIVYFPLNFFISVFLPRYTDSLFIFRVIFPGLSISTAVTVVMHNYYKTLGVNIIYFKRSIVVLVLSAILNLIAYFVFHTTIAISIASIIAMLIWYLYSESFFIKKYAITGHKSFLYLIIMMIIFYVVTIIHDLLISAILYLFLYIVVSIVFWWKTRKTLKTVFDK